jgi:pimeloyl-ACP methyl ester carboxylesterase
MRSSGSAFKLLDRGFRETLLLVPGWAADYRIFATLELEYNYLLPVRCAAADFVKGSLLAMDSAKIGTVSACGWSMGGFLAADLFRACPGRIEELTLVGMREGYNPRQLSEVRARLKKSREGYLYKFYAGCFSTNEKDLLSRFKGGLCKAYLREMDLEGLLEGLDYLEHARLDMESLKKARVRFIHGSDDMIAPLEGIAGFAHSLPGAAVAIIKGAGHMPFLGPRFPEAFHGR